MARNRETDAVQNPAILEVGLDREVLVYRQQVGTFRAMDNPRRLVKVGEKGQADTAMVVAMTITEAMVGKTVGVAVQAEMKTDVGRQKQAQKDWQKAVEKRGGVYRIIRSAADMRQLVEDVKRGAFLFEA